MSEPSAQTSPNAEPTASSLRDSSDAVGDGPDEDAIDPSPDPDRTGEPPRKRQRVRLSCLECRRRKLSCDRAFPCERCIKSGTPDKCTYESKPGPPGTVKAGIPQATFAPAYDSRRSLSVVHSPGGGIIDAKATAAAQDDRMRRLELEVQQLKAMLTKVVAGSVDGSTLNEQSPENHPIRPEVKDPILEQPLPREVVEQQQLPKEVAIWSGPEKEELRFFRGKEFRTRYFGPHNACMAFSELTGLCPFMKETADEWLKPLRIHSTKDRKKRSQEREARFFAPDPKLEALLPSKEEADVLVAAYLDQFEQVHRVVHIPTFRKQYAKFWDSGETRYGAFTALVLSIMAISICMHTTPPAKILAPKSACHQRAEKWIWACEEWNSAQSQKHRKLIHYQIACLIYLGKRVNTLKKKRFWTSAGALIQDGISVGLHRDPGHMSDRITPFTQEMRRRIWATVQEFDMQASFDHGLPTLMSQLHYDVNPPRNLDDDDFAEDTAVLPPSKPTKEYTFSSYQHISRQSLDLRLNLSHYLNGPPGDMDYDQVIRYTNDITQEIDALPSWDVTSTPVGAPNQTTRKPLLAYTLLHIQLRQYLIPLHQPYLRLRQKNSKYQYSEIIYYNAARDMVLLHDKLAEQGIRTLYFLREDALTTAINLCSVTMLQPRGSTNMIMINSQHTLRLLEKCLAMKEDRLLRCGNNEPWGYTIMCAAYGLLEAHLGIKTPEQAKAASADRFVDLHYKLVGGRENAQSHFLAHHNAMMANGVGTSVGGDKAMTPMGIPGLLAPQLPVDGLPQAWMIPSADPQAPGLIPDFNLELLGLNLNDLWGEQWDF